MEGKAFITGATGMLGSHIAERLRNEGVGIRALVRKTSNVELLKSMNAELVTGDLADEDLTFGECVEGVDYVFHVAANVDDWADFGDMRRINVLGVKKLLEACAGRPIKRFVYVSSQAVLGMGRQDDVDETAPYVHTGDAYNETKIEAEQLVLQAGKNDGLPVVAVRPPYIYGPRDRQFFPRLIGALRDGSFMYIAKGEALFTLVYVRNLVDALMLAAGEDAAVGQTYIIADDEPITRRELVEMICEEMGYPKPAKSVPLWLAKALCPVFESIARLKKTGEPPRLNRFRLKFMATHTTFNLSKAKQDLGYAPRYRCRDALRESIRWFKEQHPEMIAEA